MPDVPDGLGKLAGLYSLADWAAYEGRQIAEYAAGTLKDWGYYTELEYTVATGKKLFITDWGGANYAGYAADAAKQQGFDIHIDDSTAVQTFVATAGQFGLYIKFTPPLIIPAGHKVRTEIFNRANHPCNQRLFLLGFEIDV